MAPSGVGATSGNGFSTVSLELITLDQKKVQAKITPGATLPRSVRVPLQKVVHFLLKSLCSQDDKLQTKKGCRMDVKCNFENLRGNDNHRLSPLPGDASYGERLRKETLATSEKDWREESNLYSAVKTRTQKELIPRQTQIYLRSSSSR